jgi:ATP-binding cassette subfamily F protein 3
MVTRNVVERALIQFSGSIVCISHDRHFLNNVTNLTCEVAGGGIKLFEGNYEYYEWKKKEETQKSTGTSKVKIESKKKSDYKEKKKIRNRLAWIEKRFTTIENEIEKERALTNNPDYNDKYEILEGALNNMNTLEKEYLELMEEQERLLK